MVIILAYELLFVALTWVMASIIKGLWEMDDRFFARLFLGVFSAAFFSFMAFLMIGFWVDPVVQSLRN